MSLRVSGEKGRPGFYAVLIPGARTVRDYIRGVGAEAEPQPSMTETTQGRLATYREGLQHLVAVSVG